MDTSKLQEAITELEQEAARCLRLAGELKVVMRRSGNGIDHSDKPARKQDHKTHDRVPAAAGVASQLVVAVDVLKSLAKPIHVDQLVPMVAERRPGATTTRATVESALVRGMKGRYKNVVRRTAPGTFEAH